MAVDTRDKRFSMIGLGDERAGLMQTPNASLDAGARRMLLSLYQGFGAVPPPPPVPAFERFTGYVADDTVYVGTVS